VSLTPKTDRVIDRAIDLLNSNRNQEALELFGLAIAETNLKGLAYGRAVALARMGQVDEAVDTLEELLRFIPNHPKARSLLRELLPPVLSVPSIKQNNIAGLHRVTQQTQWLPSTMYPDDTYLVSYPKSGNTWVRFLLANLLKKEDEDIDFHTVHKHIPEVGSQKNLLRELKRPRLIKSHAPFINAYPKVIYLVRDGRDAYVSFYYHRQKQLSPKIDFNTYLLSEDHYPCRWGEHVLSWLREKQQTRLLVVKYEDLKNDCFSQLRRMLVFLGVNRESNRIEAAIKASSFENMKRIEAEKGRLFADQGPEVFMRKGIVGDWKSHFGSKEKRFFKSTEGQLLVELGYEKDMSW
jgi:tetratricopeptide (TPR) repeat protein